MATSPVTIDPSEVSNLPPSSQATAPVSLEPSEIASESLASMPPTAGAQRANNQARGIAELNQFDPSSRPYVPPPGTGVGLPAGLGRPQPTSPAARELTAEAGMVAQPVASQPQPRPLPGGGARMPTMGEATRDILQPPSTRFAPQTVAGPATPQQIAQEPGAPDIEGFKAFGSEGLGAALSTAAGDSGIPYHPATREQTAFEQNQRNNLVDVSPARAGVTEMYRGAGDIRGGGYALSHYDPSSALAGGVPLPDYAAGRSALVDRMFRGGTESLKGAMTLGTPAFAEGAVGLPAEALATRGFGPAAIKAFQGISLYLGSIGLGDTLQAAARKANLSPDGQEFAHVAGFFGMNALLAGMGVRGFSESQGEVSRAGVEALGGRVRFQGASSPEAVGVSGKVGPFSAGYARPRAGGVNFSDQVPGGAGLPTGEPAPVSPPNPTEVEHQQRMSDVTQALTTSAGISHAADQEAGLAPPPPPPGAPGSGKAPLPQGMDSGTITQDTASRMGGLISLIPPKLRPSVILGAVSDITKWITGQRGGIFVGPDGKVQQAETPKDADKIAIGLVNAEVENQNARAESERQQQQQASSAAAQERQAGATSAREQRQQALVEKAATRVLGRVPKGTAPEALTAILARNLSGATPEQIKAVVDARVKGEEGEKQQAALTVQRQVDPEIERLNRGDIPWVFVPKAQADVYSPKAPEGVKRTAVAGAGDRSGIYYHDEEIDPADLRTAARTNKLPDLHEQWKAKSAAPESPAEQPATVAAPEAKAPARTPLDEFEARGGEPYQVTQQEWTDLQRAHRRALGQSEESGTRFAPFADYEEYHRQSVKDALAAGKAVPESALKNYPDLAARPTELQPDEIAEESPAPAERRYEFGSTQAPVPTDSEAHQAVTAAQGKIADEDLAGKGKDVDAPHVTVRYGIQGEDTDGIRKYIEAQRPFTAKLGRTELFPPSKNSDGAAVVNAPVESPELHRMNAEIEKHGDFAPSSFPEYKPHVTVAYVKPEAAEKYRGMADTEGKSFPVNSIEISDRDGNKTTVQLKGGRADESEVARPEQPKGNAEGGALQAAPAAPNDKTIKMLTGGKTRGVRLDHLLEKHPGVKVLSIEKESLDPSKLIRIQSWTREQKLTDWQNAGVSVKDLPRVEVVRTGSGDYLYDGTHRAEFAARRGERVPATVYTVETRDEEPKAAAGPPAREPARGDTVVYSEGNSLQEGQIRALTPGGKFVIKGRREAIGAKQIVHTGPMAEYLKEHFKPGNVIQSDYWKNYDKVLAFEPGSAERGWRVQVVQSDKDGNPLEGERPRWHSTIPSPKDEVVKSAPAEPAQREPEETTTNGGALHSFVNMEDGIKAEVHRQKSGKYAVTVSDTEANEQLPAIQLFDEHADAIRAAKLAVGEEEAEEEAAPKAGDAEAAAMEADPTRALVKAIYDKLEAGEPLGNVTALAKLAETHLGAARISGAWTPKDMFDAMEAAVNRYIVAHGKRWMEMDPQEALKEIRAFQAKLTSQGVRTEEQIKKQQFSTPPTESYVAARVAALSPSDVVLEPSAGNGGIAAWPLSIGAQVFVNEIASRRQEMLRAAGFGEPTGHNGEIIHALLDPSIKPTVILMNPPFSAGALGGRNRNVYGFNHVESALQRLENGGRLVAILGGGKANEPNGGASLTAANSGAWFKKIAKLYNVRANVRIDGKEYAKYGTSFATRLIVIDKDGPTPDLTKVLNRNVDTLEEAYGALKEIAGSRPHSVEPPGAGSARTGDQNSIARPQPSGSVASGTGPGGGIRRGELRGGPEDQGGIRPQQESGLVNGNARSDESERRPEPAVGGEAPLRPVESGQNESGDSSQGDSGDIQPIGRSSVEGRGLTPELEVERAEVPASHEAEGESQYVNYQPSIKGAEHPGHIVESKTMATIPLPPFEYKPALPKATAEEKLSAVQMEAVILTGQANDERLAGGARSTCLIGDGTGVGKGREAAGIIFDNWNKGRRRLLWVSQTGDLMQAAIRDLNGVGAGDLAKRMVSLQKFNAGEAVDHEGVLYATYALVRSEDKKGRQRSAQIQNWLRGKDDAEGGFVLFDESHNLKNAVVGQGGQASQIGQVVKKLLEENPNLRSSSLSATAASEVMNLGYLDRLGLWGPGTAFPAGFNQFVNEIGQGGMSAMEMVARELKAQGKYLSRTLDFSGATYDMVEANLNADQTAVYRSATQAWAVVNDRVDHAIGNLTNGGTRQKARWMAQFYSTQLRFFNVLLTTLKVPAIIPRIEEDLKNGKSVVVTIVNTNEAAQNREKARVAIDSSGASDQDEIPEYDFGPAEMLISLVHEYFPTQQYADGVDDQGRPIKVPVTDAEGNPVENPEAVRTRDELVKNLKQNLKMPANPLDVLIQSLGGPSKVAEMTGRKEYFDEASGKFVSRGDPGTARDKVNLEEQRKFQSGKKRIAVLSNAAGTGIDLHASLDEPNQQRRSHYTLQSGWSADKAMQMLGRTLRTRQASSPEYHLVVSNLGGEQRFVATIAKRLGSLNAISKGQKSAGAGVDLMDKVNFESEQGRQAAQAFYDNLLRGGEVPGVGGESLAGREALRQMHVLKTDPQSGQQTVPPADRTNVTRLLNRVLALDPEVQNAVYYYYFDIFNAICRQAIEDGTLDTGVRELPGDEHRIAEQRDLSSDPKTGAKTTYYRVESQIRNQRASLADMDRERGNEGTSRYEGAKLWINPKSGQVALSRPASPIVHANGSSSPALYIIAPNKGARHKVARADMERHYVTIDEHAAEQIGAPEREVSNRDRQVKQYEGWATSRGADEAWVAKGLERSKAELSQAQEKLTAARKEWSDPEARARELWGKQYDETPAHRTEQNHMVGGAVLRWWGPIREASGANLRIFTARDAKAGKRIVGVSIPPERIEGLTARIGGGESRITGASMATDVLRNGTEYRLEGNIRVTRARIGRDSIVRLHPPTNEIGEHLKQLGAIYERGAQPLYYIPVVDGWPKPAVLNQILKQYPIQEAGGQSVSAPSPSGSVTFSFMGTQNAVEAAKGLGKLFGQQAQNALEDLAPTLGMARDAGKEVLHFLYPRAGVPEDALDIMGEARGRIEEKQFWMRNVMGGLSKVFDAMGKEANVEFIDRVKQGREQETPFLESIAKLVRKIDDHAIKEAQVFRPSLTAKENHYRVIWKVIPFSGGREGNKAVGNIRSRRPFAGDKGFMQRSTLDTMSEGILGGGVPHTWNAWDMFMRAQASIDKFISAARAAKNAKDAGLAKFVRNGRQAPEGWQRGEDKMWEVYRPRTAEEGDSLYQKTGEWWLEPGFARVFNNYVSRDLIRSSSIGRMVVNAKNFSTALELGFNLFHWGYIGAESMASSVGLGMMKVLNQGIGKGSPQEALAGVGDIATSLLAPYRFAHAGGGALKMAANATEFMNTPAGKDFVSKFPNGPRLMHLLFSGGMVWGMPEGFRTDWGDGFVQSLKDQHFAKAVLELVPWINKQVMKPLFQTVIPRIKWGFAMEQLAQQLAERSDELANGDVTEQTIARQVVDSVENRFGEMNFDNLYWNNTFKTAMQVSLRSVTWKLGSWRGLAQAGAETADLSLAQPIRRMYEDARSGNFRPKGEYLPKLGMNAAWLIGMATFMAIAGSAAVWLMTKKPLWEWAKEDEKLGYSFLGGMAIEAMHWRTGRYDPKTGLPERLSPPTGLRDYEHGFMHPGRYLKGSLSSVTSNAWDTLANRDVYGNYVYNPNDPTYKEFVQGLLYNAHGDLVPISVKNWQGDFGAQDTGSRIARAMGVENQGASLDRSRAENDARARKAHTPMTPEQVEQRRERDASPRRTPREIMQHLRYQRMTGIERAFEGLSYADARDIYEHEATDAERRILGPIMAQKRERALRKGVPAQ